MPDEVGRHPIFDSWYGRSSEWGPDGKWSASFGGNVLGAVTSALDDYLALRDFASQRRQPAVLGCTPWLSDRAVVDRLLRFRQSCIVINKPDGIAADLRQVRRLHDEGPGFPPAVLPEFNGLAPSEDGQPALVGPSFKDPSSRPLSSVRVAGVTRQQGVTQPLVHAKMLLLGMTIESEGDMGEQVIFFRPQRLWLGSANLTNNSRRGLEFGIWTDDVSLVDLGRGFLSDLLTYSEPLSSYQPRAVPERIPYEFDDAAFYEYFRELEEGRLREGREGAVDSASAARLSRAYSLSS